MPKNSVWTDEQRALMIRRNRIYDEARELAAAVRRNEDDMALVVLELRETGMSWTRIIKLMPGLRTVYSAEALRDRGESVRAERELEAQQAAAASA